MQFDVNDEGVLVEERPFPSEIAFVSGLGSRPDGVIWSMQTNTVIWIELTSPCEENLTKKHFEKMDKYNELAIDLRSASANVQDAAVACSYYIFLCRFLRTWEPQALVDTLERSEC